MIPIRKTIKTAKTSFDILKEMDWLPLYPFGYGISYTNFEYSNIRLSKTEIRADETVEVRFDVTNIGNCKGDKVTQLYIHDEYSSVLRPYKELSGFSFLNNFRFW